MTATDAARVAEARRWFREQGHTPVRKDGVTSVVTPEHPDTWDANWVAADPGATAEALFAALDEHMAHSRWQVVQVDCLTDPAIEAALALADFKADSTLIEMLARDVSTPRNAPPVALQPVGTAEWPRFAELVRTDHREGRRTGAHDEGVAAGLLDGMRRRIGPCAYWLIVERGEALGYGMTAVCPNGLGLLENLFTLPEHRARGLMSGFIVEASRRLRTTGCDAVFLDAHAHDTPKHLYARLGFEPIAVTRTWVRKTIATG